MFWLLLVGGVILWAAVVVLIAKWIAHGMGSRVKSTKAATEANPPPRAEPDKPELLKR